MCLWYFSCNDQWRSQDYCKYIVALCFVVVEEDIGLVLGVLEKTKMCYASGSVLCCVGDIASAPRHLLRKSVATERRAGHILLLLPPTLSYILLPSKISLKLRACLTIILGPLTIAHIRSCISQ